MPNKNLLQKGFSLTELLVAIFIGSVIAAVSTILVTQTYKTFTFSNENLTVQSNARVVFNRISDELRQAEKIESVTENSIIFYKPDWSNPYPSKVEYILENGSTLMRYFTPAQGDIPNVTYPLENRQATTLSQYIVYSEPIFKVYDHGGNELQYNQISNIKLLKLKLFFDRDTNKDPQPFILQSDVQFRNFKIN